MTQTEAQELVSSLAAQAASIEARRVDLGHTTGRPGPVAALKLVPGAQIERQVFRRDGEEPYALESVEIVLNVGDTKVRVYAQWSRGLEPAELAAFEHAVKAGEARQQKPLTFVVADLGGHA